LSGYKVARLDEIEEIDDGREPFRPVRHHLGISAFGITAWTARDAGDRIINEHDEDEPGGHEELYVVTKGHATFEVDGEKVEAPEGTMVFLPPGPRRTAFAEEAGTTILAIGGAAGQAYDVQGWEIWAPANPHYRAGDYERVIEMMKPVVEEHPQYTGLLYNLACVESLAGHTDDAIEHLRRAVDGWPQAKELAREDSDFEAVREEPGFKQLVE
jgi:tetratricopeptide (TPR) repeat protein